MIDLEAGKKNAVTSSGSPSVSLRLASVFHSGAVLQRDISLPVWGYAAPGAPVRVRLGNAVAHTVAHPIDGRFFLRLPPQVAAEGQVMTVENLQTGESVVLEDIAIGEVYIAAGQSNMAIQVRECDGWAEECDAPADRALRFYKTEITTFTGVQTECRGEWCADSPESRGDFSAVAYYFARKLRRELQIPVGILSVSRGGVNLESWVSRGELMELPEYAEESAHFDIHSSAPEDYQADGSLMPDGAKFTVGLNEMFPEMPLPAGENAPEAAVDFDDSVWQQLVLPASWTLAGYNHAGIFWFRREIFLPEDAACSREWTLSLGAVDKADETYVNGKLVGSTGNPLELAMWNVPRKYTLEAGILKPGRNVIAVRAASMVSIATDGGFIGPAGEMYLSDGESRLELTGIWKLSCVKNYGTEGMTFMRSLGTTNYNSLHVIYDNVLSPLAPYALRGAIFYQGEANAICMAHTYKALLKAMMRSWKRLWEQAAFDFTIVQLPYYGECHAYEAYSQWALLREAQLEASAECEANLVVSMPYGDNDDLHPRNKIPAGENAAMLAISRIQGEASMICRPEAICRNESTLELHFRCDAGKMTGNNGNVISGFAIAGADGVVYPANAGLCDGEMVRVWSENVPAPEFVWYNWSDHADVSGQLLDGRNMPVSPFRMALEADVEIPAALPFNGIPML